MGTESTVGGVMAGVVAGGVGDGARATTGGVRVRAYRVERGECTLLTLGAGDRAAHVLLGCGVHPGAGGSAEALRRAVDDVARECGGRLDVVVACREQADHVAGFATSLDVFARLDVGEVWLPRALDPEDRATADAASQRRAIATALAAKLEEGGPAGRLGAHLARNAAGGGAGLDALRGGLRTRAKVRYLGAGDVLADPADIAGLDAFVLGAMHAGRATHPGVATPSDAATRAGAAAAMADVSQAGSRRGGSAFPGWELPRVDRTRITAAVEAQVQQAAAGDDDAHAARLDAECNAGGLALLLRFGGRALLFPGDAPWTAWDWAWAEPRVALSLAALDFCAVGRHDGRGANRARFLRALGRDRTLALVHAATTPAPPVPSPGLAADLDARARAWARTDAAPTFDARGAVSPHRGAPPPPRRHFTTGAMWIDCTLA